MSKPLDKIGPYTLVSKLGRGAFGVVWLAEKRTAITTTKVAIKIPNDDDIDLEAVKQEASLWVHASGHPNVLPIIDADIYDERVVIVSEYAPDGSLSKWLKRHGGKAPSIEAAVDMMLGILAGLEHLHKREIIHRDLKPDNILLQNDTPRLADFGIARILKTTSHSTIATGTPAYMPPEAFDGKRSEQTDIWSAGVIFYQLLSGRLPFPQEEFTALVGAILTKEPEPLSGALPLELGVIIERALAKEPGQRYASAGEMRRALRAASLAQGSINVRPEAATQVLPPRVTEPPSTITSPELPLPTSREIVSTITGQIPVYDPAPRKDSSSTPVRKASRRPWLVGGLAALLAVLGLLTALVGYYLFKPVEENSPGASNPSFTDTANKNEGSAEAAPRVSSSPARTNSPPGSSADAAAELKARIDAVKPLDDYSAYRSGNAYYVRIPKTKMSALTITTAKGVAEPSWEEQANGDLLLKFEIPTGRNAEIQQFYNRLEITFSAAAAS